MKNIEKIIDGKLFYRNFDLSDIAKRYGTPLKVIFLDDIKEKILNLKQVFDFAVEQNKYTGKFIYATANKANYSAENLYISSMYSDSIEISSLNDLKLTLKLLKLRKVGRNKLLICNGIKSKLFLDSIIKYNNQGYNILNIIDNIEELEYLLKSTSKELQVGIRVNISKSHIVENDRFGITDIEMEKTIKILQNQNKLKLTTLHYHNRGMIYNDKDFFENLKFVFEKYYIPISKQFSTLINLDLGGGTPYSSYEDFDYKCWAGKIIEYIQNLNSDMPNIILENGRYTVKDSMVNIYKIEEIKQTNNDFLWYIIDGSFLIAMSEVYQVGEQINVTAINLLKNDMIKTKLSGLTCDCDDVYFEKEKGYINLPKIIENQNLYIGIIGTGSYQESLSGRNGIHHCLLPEEKRIVIYTKNGKQKIKVLQKLQSHKNIFKIIHCTRRNLYRFN